MSLTQTAPDDSIDLELGEVYYGGQKTLEDQLANEIIVVIKPNEIISVNRKLLTVAGSRKIDTAYTDHFPKDIKDHAAGTLNKRNDVDQILIFKNWRMTLNKSRYGPSELWNQYRAVAADDGNNNRTLAIWFGETQHPTREVDNAGIFMTALQNAQQDLGTQKIKESELVKVFIELHVAAQRERNIKSDNSKEMARSAFRRELKAATNGGIVVVEHGFVVEIKHAF